MSPTMWENVYSKGTGWLFIEFPQFSRSRPIYFEKDEQFASAQSTLVANPTAGDTMPGCGGVRKLRLPDPRRGKGSRGGLRLIYLQIPETNTIVLIDVYDKNEQDDLTQQEKKTVRMLAAKIKAELIAKFGRGS